MNTLTQEPARAVIDRLFAAATAQEDAPPAWPAGWSHAETTAQERADLLAEIYMPVSVPGCRLLYALTRATRPPTVVEFGTSYGISTLHLAAAVADNGTGHVFTTELSRVKVAAATANLTEAGLADQVTVLEGDALTTLRDVPAPIGLLVLDGWKELCLPVLRLLEGKLPPGALVIADDTTFESMADYLAYVRAPANGYVSVDFAVEDGMEISCRVPQ
jgi:predicted O-methyltransferase YrrM